MKNFASFYKIILVILVLGAGWNCSGGAKPGQETASKQTTPSATSSKLDPLDLPQDSRIIPRLQPHKGEISGSGEVSKVVEDTVAEKQTPTTNTVLPQVDTLANQALRIQLHSIELFGEAKRERLIAEEIFDQPVFLDYEVPYYKVRVGSFSERKKAEAYLQTVKTAGYQNAWIVAVRVNVKEPRPLYENLPAPKADSLKGK